MQNEIYNLKLLKRNRQERLGNETDNDKIYLYVWKYPKVIDPSALVEKR